MKIRNYLITLLLTISIVPLILVMTFSTLYFWGNSQKDLQDNMQNTSRLAAENVNQFFLQRRSTLACTASLPAVVRLLNSHNGGAEITELTDDSTQAAAIFSAMTAFPSTDKVLKDTEVNTAYSTALVGRDNIVIASDDPALVGKPSSLEKDMRTVSSSAFSVSNIISDSRNGRQYFILAVPIYQDSTYKGFIQSDIDLSYFNMISAQHFMAAGWSMVIDGNGTVVGSNVRDPDGLLLHSLNSGVFQNDFYGNVWKKLDFSAQSNGFLQFSENGSEKQAHFTTVQGTNWVTLSTVPQSELLRPIQKILIVFGIVLAVFIVLLAYLSFHCAKRFSVPLHDIRDAFMRLMQRDYSVRLTGRYKGEFEEISTAFNTLVEKIHEDTDELKVSEARYALIMEETNQVIFEWDIPENHIYHTVHWTNKFGFSMAVENPGSELPEFSPVHPDDREAIASFFWAARQGIQPKPIDVRMKTINSKYIWCMVSVKLIFDENKQPFRAIGLITDTDHQKKMIQSLESKSRMDLLTQTFNKVTTEKMIEEFLSTACPSEHHGFVIMDIDNFKGVNDTLGHIYGDSVLKEISSRLKELFRSTDIVGRAGGDEFIILIKDLPDDRMLDERLDEICRAFRGISAGENDEYPISASVGAAIFPSDGTTFAELYQHADSALYEVKEKGKDGFCRYHATLKIS